MQKIEVTASDGSVHTFVGPYEALVNAAFPGWLFVESTEEETAPKASFYEPRYCSSQPETRNA